MKRVILCLAALVLIGAGIYGIMSDREDTPVLSQVPETVSAAAVYVEPTPTANPLLPADLQSITIDPSASVPLDTVPSSYTTLVNQDYLLPSGYVPKDLVELKVRFSSDTHEEKRKMRKVAAQALKEMFKAAEKKNVILYGVSGYRSYARQKNIYNQNVALHGKKATDALSAKPGSSEHQTGLTIDVSVRSLDCLLTERFASTREGKWLAKNAHKYGYIIRYPAHKSKITGYSYEPWHIRYVGVTVATYLYKNDLTLEEYYGVSGNKDEKNTVVDIEDEDTYESAKASPTPTSTATPSATPQTATATP